MIYLSIYKSHFRKRFLIRFVLVSLILLSYGQVNSQEPKLDNLLIDIDGNVYRTIHIGYQKWMAENLRTSRYANGEPIANVLEDDLWIDLKTGAWCQYMNDGRNDIIYGKLYNWHAVSDPRELCPDGWTVPSEQQWLDLANFLGGLLVAGGKLKTAGFFWEEDGSWFWPNEAATNESGFSALPAGVRSWKNGSYIELGEAAYFWNSTIDQSIHAWCYFLRHDYEDLLKTVFNSYPQENGMSVRCIQILRTDF